MLCSSPGRAAAFRVLRSTASTFASRAHLSPNPAVFRQIRTMASSQEIEKICEDIKQNYSSCDVADALLKLKVPWAGFLPDIAPIPRRGDPSGRVVAPISTMRFVPKSYDGSQSEEGYQTQSNIPKDIHWTDCPKAGTIVLMQQPKGQVCALLGDLVATRLKTRGVKAAVIDGRVRDISSLGSLCSTGDFQVWSKAISAVGTGLQAKPWTMDGSIQIGEVKVEAGDILVADEDDRGITVIPKDKLEAAYKLLPGLKEADDKVLKDIHAGVKLDEAFARHR